MPSTVHHIRTKLRYAAAHRNASLCLLLCDARKVPLHSSLHYTHVIYWNLPGSLHIRSELKKYLGHTQEVPILLSTLVPHGSQTGDGLTNDSGSTREVGEPDREVRKR